MKIPLLALVLSLILPTVARAQEPPGDAPQNRPVVSEKRREQVEHRAANQAKRARDPSREEKPSVQKALERSQARGNARSASDRPVYDDARAEPLAPAQKTDGPRAEGSQKTDSREKQDEQGTDPGSDRRRDGAQKTDPRTDRPKEASETTAPKLPEPEAQKTDKVKVDGPPSHRAEMIKKLEHEERKHRERLAKIARLRELAREKNQDERLRALEELERKENERYDRYRHGARSTLGEGEFDEIDRGLGHGRGHGRAQDARVHDERDEKDDRAGAEHRQDGEHRQGAEHRQDDQGKSKKDKP